MCSFKKLSLVSCAVSKNCHQFQKTVTSFMCSFKKLSPASCSFKKMSPVSCPVSKKTVTFRCTSGETIRHFATKKTRVHRVILTACKKTFFRVAKCWNSVQIFLYGGFFWTFFFFQKLFLNWVNFLCNFFFHFFQTYPRKPTFIKLKWNLHKNFLKLFETFCNCHSFTETCCKKKVVIGIKSAKSPVSRETEHTQKKVGF